MNSNINALIIELNLLREKINKAKENYNRAIVKVTEYVKKLITEYLSESDKNHIMFQTILDSITLRHDWEEDRYIIEWDAYNNHRCSLNDFNNLIKDKTLSINHFIDNRFLYDPERC